MKQAVHFVSMRPRAVIDHFTVDQVRRGANKHLLRFMLAPTCFACAAGGFGSKSDEKQSEWLLCRLNNNNNNNNFMPISIKISDNNSQRHSVENEINNNFISIPWGGCSILLQLVVL